MATNPFTQQKPIEGIKNIVLIGSGKGGVGKSTVAANLAVAARKQGEKVGLLDADIYGPSLPRMMGAMNQKPPIDDNNKIIPLTRHGVKLMSIGFLVEEGSAVVWRGPMLFKAIDQFLRDVDWGELDTLFVDLPPGTGDIGLTLAQKVPVTGGLVVLTPQNIALIDAKKLIDMYERVNIPVLGVIENMSYMIPAEGGEPVQLFPRGELDGYLDAKGLKKLAQIPFQPSIGLTSEAGIPIIESEPDSREGQAFTSLAGQLSHSLKETT